MSVLMNYAMFPTDKGSSVSHYVSRIINYIKSSGYNYKLTPMSTIVETETIEEALQLLSKSYELLGTDCERVYSSITLDIQTNKPFGRMESKIESIVNIIGEINK